MSVTSQAFPTKVHDELQYYVYRLIDPRNGETFYVGKGKGDRVFDHANGKFEIEAEYAAGSKKERINEILVHGHQVTHIIHRHGLTNHVATEVEAALIDAYPGLTNSQLGAGSKDRGVRHTDDIIRQYAAPYCELQDPLILISIGQSWRTHGVYEGVRGVWKVNINRARKYPLVLARVRDLIVGVFEPEQWLPGTAGNFPLFPELPNNWGLSAPAAGRNCESDTCTNDCRQGPSKRERWRQSNTKTLIIWNLPSYKRQTSRWLDLHEPGRADSHFTLRVRAAQ